MIEYRIDYEDQKVADMFKKLEDDMPEINHRILGVLSGEVIEQSVMRYVQPQFHHPTGKLAQSLDYKVYGGSYAEIGTNLVYAPVQEFGATIRPGAKGFLAWQDRMTGKWIYTRKPVTIPARPYLRPALDDIFASGRAVVSIERVLNDEIDKLERAS
jgi:phage gpG-like protein